MKSAVFITPENGHYFFGYYDKSPLSNDNTKLLACRSAFFDRMPKKEDVLEIGYFNWKASKEFIKLTETKAWNWQQGCMLQWLGNDCNSKIIYNDRIDNKFVSVIFDLDTKIKTILPMAYYSASSDGDFALCIDNERHYWYRGGYNYQGIENTEKKQPIDKNDGIWRLDIDSNKVHQIINIKQLLEYKPLSTMMDSIHYLEHIMLSPNNERFAFLHRWQSKEGNIHARLYTANTAGNELYLLNDSGRMSHFCWKNDNELIGWGGLANPVNQLRKYKNIARYLLAPLLPIYHRLFSGNSLISNKISGDSYIVFKDKSDLKSRVFTQALQYDGHPSFSIKNENIMITDIYPNKQNGFKQILYQCDLTNETVEEMDIIDHDRELAASSCRCDLHPKLSHDGKYVCIDRLDKEYRGMSVYKF